MKNKKLKKKNIYTQKKSMNLVSVDIIQRVRAFLLYILCHIKQYTTIPPTIIYGGYDDIPTQLPCYLNCTPRIDTNLIILLFYPIVIQPYQRKIRPLLKGDKLLTLIQHKEKQLELIKMRLRRRAIKIANWYYHIMFILAISAVLIALEVVGYEHILTLPEILTYSIVGALTIIPFINYIRYWVCRMRVLVYNKNVDPSNYCILRCGEPGSGKTSSAIYTAVLLAKKLWLELRYKYWHGMTREHELFASGNLEAIKDWKRVKQSYLYWINHPGAYPCLMSNIPLIIEGKSCVVAKRAHLEQLLPVPEYTVLLYDEIGSIVRVDEGKHGKPLNISDMYRWCRQFAEARLISTEQDKANVYIDMRRVTTENTYLRKQTAILKPPFWSLIYNIMRKHYVKRMSYQDSLEHSLPMYFMDCFIEAIGFRKYRYRRYGSTESGNREVESKGTYILPSLLNAKYDSRYYRRQYQARDMSLDILEIWSNKIEEDKPVRKNKHKSA